MFHPSGENCITWSDESFIPKKKFHSKKKISSKKKFLVCMSYCKENVGGHQHLDLAYLKTRERIIKIKTKMQKVIKYKKILYYARKRKTWKPKLSGKNALIVSEQHY